MKKTIILIVLILFGFTLQAQQDDWGIVGRSNWLNGWSSFNPVGKEYPQTTKILTGNISSDLTLTNLETYNLVGEVYVTNNAKLTIEPGTIIRASSSEYSAIIITKGSKLIAEGQVVNPIVFTSDKPTNERKPGDWGGIFILGGAPINTYGNVARIESEIPSNFRVGGGELSTDSSGSIKNVRIEFAGRGKDRYETYDALTLVGVGSGTILESIQVSLSSGNSYKFIGGNPKATKLVSFRSKSSDFNFTQGTIANIENGLALRNPFFSSSTNFRGVTVKPFDNKDMTDLTKPATNVSLNNFTIVNEVDGQSATQGLIKEAIYVNKDCLFTFKNSIVSGFDSALLLNENIEVSDPNLTKIKLQRVFINNCKKNIVSEIGGITNDDLESYYAQPSFANRYSKTKSEDLFVDANNQRTPDFRLKIGSIN
ncbi:hypothetical protein SY27_11515 [Flavobacterium sp. 316]|uniref:T9SS C-terminal target domain-containing protein n=1 Tax=Flavobacterium sediminilitoris TaxID=2024526 RepID=A0ABY4HTL3_9FLAO|nr:MULTISPECIES: hypothetical protein [Flavobacterium]KIX20535.1 hypothetical protein SY27_11515 [Flavobacterium sp. 316]UOX34899.1 hypothetical protein LXD69_05150 [Flavobacterium sediminilitoris]